MNARRANNISEKVRQLQEKLGHAAKTSETRRFHALYDKVYDWKTLCEAWRKVRSNKGSAGIDGETLKDIEEMGVLDFLLDCYKRLKEGNYHPQPVKRQYILKKDGRKRPLGIPTVRDRVIQAATKLVIEPIFEADFKDCSYGFRPMRNAKQALDRVRKACNRNGNWVLDVDIQSFFDNINQDKLMKLVKMRISDKRVLKLIRKWLKAGVMEEGKVSPSDLGTPQGGVISPLLANIYLNYFDRLWEKHGSHLGELTRYADDFVIVCKTRRNAQRAHILVRRIMERLDLTLHPVKTKMVSLWNGKEGFDFLGLHHRKGKAETSKGQVYWTTQQWLTKKAEQNIRDKVRAQLGPPSARVLSVEDHVKSLNLKIRGWRGYYWTPYSTHKMASLDWYILRRFAKWFAKKTSRRRINKRLTHRLRHLLSQNGLLSLV